MSGHLSRKDHVFPLHWGYAAMRTMSFLFDVGQLLVGLTS